ncbi:MAG: choice-of-anchor D domain-containing protein [Terriglobia bacterium]
MTAPRLLQPANFGNVPQGTSSSAKNFTLTNNQSVALNIASITTGNPEYTQTNTCGSNVAAKGHCTISVTFTPSIIGTETGTLSVADNASNSPQTAALTGTGIVQAKVAPTSLTFAAQKVGTTSAAKNVTLTNNLSTALTISSITFTGANAADFGQTNTCGSSLAAKSTCTIGVTFTPSAKGTRTATLNVNDSANNSPQTASLTGTGK